MSTNLMVIYLHETGVNAKMLPALDFMKIDAAGEPDNTYIRNNIHPLLEKHSDADIYITKFLLIQIIQIIYCKKITDIKISAILWLSVLDLNQRPIG